MKRLNLPVKLFAVLILLNIGVFAQNDKKLSGKHWVLTEIDSSKIGATGIFIEFDESKNSMTAFAGCNSVFGTIKLKGENLKFSGLKITLKACLQGKTALLERNFIKTLEKTTKYKKTNDVLTLYSGKTAILKFKKAAATEAEKIEAPDQNMNSINKPKTVTKNNSGVSASIWDKEWTFSLPAEDQPGNGEIASITFHGDGNSANGDSGCGGFGGEYKIDGDKMTFTPTMMTDRMCPEESRRNLSSKFMNGLGTANRFVVVNGNLNLYRDDELLIILKTR